jgi:site-specific recombinase XerD
VAITTDEFLARFEAQYLDYNRISPKRVREQLNVLRQLAYQMAPRSLAEMTYDDLQSFAAEQVASGLHVNTVRKKLNMIRPAFSWAYAAKLINADDYLSLRAVKDPRGSTHISSPNPYTPDEVREYWRTVEEKLPLLPTSGPGSQRLNRWLTGKTRFYKVARHAMRLQIEAVTYLALHGGLRREEIHRCSINDAHYDNRFIVVHGAQKGKNFDRDTTRKAPMTAEMRKALYDWIEFRTLMRPEHDRLWVSCYGPDTYRGPMDLPRFGELLVKVVGPGWSLQRFRHTAATEWLRAGASLEIVSQLLGHETLQQTRAYTLLLEDDLERELGGVAENFNRRLRRVA